MQAPSSCLSFSLILLLGLLLFSFSWYPRTSKQYVGCSWNRKCYTLTLEAQRHGSVVHSDETPRHPLDPLTLQEIKQVRAVLSSYGPFSSSFPAIHSLSLEEPEKSAVLGWKRGYPLPPRQASVIAVLNGQTEVLLVDLGSGRVTSHSTHRGSGYPTLTMEDIQVATQVPFSDPEFNKSIIARGVRFSDLVCISPSSGWFGPDEEGRRIIKIQCASSQGTANFFMRPIEGLTVTVDIDRKKVVRISDTGRKIPVPAGTNTEYRYTAQEKPPEMELINPISMEQPKGPSFTVEDGHMVKWANWEFHLKADQRAGMVISQAKVRDSETGELRSVMYKGFASEMFVPYMDPDEAWYFKSYMDGGEFGLGAMALPLVPLNDCPRNSYYMDGVFVAADGKPFLQTSMICVFERYAGDIGWRHSEALLPGFDVSSMNNNGFAFGPEVQKNIILSSKFVIQIREARPKVSLVARTAATVGNYDYIFDWEFQTDGLIRVKVNNPL